MRVHHLNCGSLAEIEPVDGADSPLKPTRAVCHCLLIETDSAGLVLVETGIGTPDIADPDERLGADWIAFAAPALDPAETAVRQVARLGYSPEDVRHVVLTHLHSDHAGGLGDFPDATVHVHAAEHAAALSDSGTYRSAQLAHGPRWATYEDGRGDPWFGFEGVRPLDGLPPEILMVPLGGHTPGHVAVAVDDADRPLLHAGDAYFYHGEVDRPDPCTHPLLDLVQVGAEVDRALRLDNVARLRELALKNEIEVFCAHDPWEFDRYR
ncbi:MBL fold metallo-hydrolase [Spirillospora sp. NBC_01491]|uniref:MBL fold metallo-hydrolase n=1 Tax=Spirillospora sp. NBC_01491 TaxID=2976007 RepID=UPI002E31A51D|nr:MBL fold metallo-hydrolase [Spirillospora sp. NBC_01491]